MSGNEAEMCFLFISKLFPLYFRFLFFAELKRKYSGNTFPLLGSILNNSGILGRRLVEANLHGSSVEATRSSSWLIHRSRKLKMAFGKPFLM